MRFKMLKNHLSHTIPCVCYGILCGALTGTTIFLFKLAATYAEEFSRFLYDTAKTSPVYIALCFLVLIGLAFLMAAIHKKAPECKGGGIPRSEGILRGALPFRHFRTLLGTFFGSLISFFAGVPVGSEGPAVLIGTSIGKITGSPFRNQVAWDRYVMTGGAGAGFAVATGAPLSGILFALEEIHKRFSPLLILTVSMSVLSATFTNHLLCDAFHISPNLFEISVFPALELKYLGYFLLLALLIAVAVGIFDVSILLFRRFTVHSKNKSIFPVKLIVVFMLTGILGLTFTDGVYSGHHLVAHIFSHSMGLGLLIVLFLIRLVMMLLITDSGVTGGIFIPTLAIGALASAIITKLLVLLGMPEELCVIAIFLGMCAFIGGTLRAPLTACVLFLELSGQFTNLLFVAIVMFGVSFITELFHLTPFYDTALEEMTEAHQQGKTPTISSFRLTVSEDAFVVGKAVRDIMWPHASVITGISHLNHGEEMDDGEQRLYAGDTITLRARYFEKDEILQLLEGLVGTEYPIEIKD